MLAVRPKAQRAWTLDWSVVALAVFFGAVAIAVHSILAYVVAAVVTGAALGSVCVVRRTGDDVVVTGPLRRTKRLPAARCAVGVRTSGAGIRTYLRVYLTDGEVTVDVVDFLPAGVARAQRTAARLAGAVLDAPAPAAGAAFVRVAADRTAMSHAWIATPTFYRNPAFWWAVSIGLILVTAYLVIGFLFFD